MRTLIVNPKLSNIYNTVENLSMQELDSLLIQIKKIRYQQFPIVLPKDEADLLKKINSGLPIEIQIRASFIC